MKHSVTIILGVALGVLIAILFLNQGKLNTEIANRLGYTKICIDNVSYVIFPNGASVQYKPTGEIKTCDE